jgi:zinc transporter ZupT
MIPLITDAGLAASVTAIALISAAVGMRLTASPRMGRVLVPFGAGLLMGMALFGIWPQLSETLGWAAGLGALSLGFALLWTVNRYVYPVCPSCSAAHDHGACAATLHGFALPLVAAAMLHSLMDGLAVGAAHDEGQGRLAWGIFLGIAIHKIPEGLAYGTILRAALRSRVSALGWCAVAQAPTIVGALIESLATYQFGVGWLIVLLGFAGGSFLFLGYHAIHNEWRRRGMLPAFGPALTGAAGAACLQEGLKVILR